MGVYSFCDTGMMIFLILKFAFFQAQITHAPELIQGTTHSAQVMNTRIAIVDGGNWKALQVGYRARETETGFFFRIMGEEIDNNNHPVPYIIEWKNDHKYNGHIYFRGHARKLCAANLASNLPCR